jgi:hypothetical protein
MRTIITLAALAITPMSLAGNPALPDVAIVAAASNTTMPETNTRFTDVRDKLVATGKFGSVSIYTATRFNPDGGTPSLATLQQWDAVLVWSNDSFDDAVAMGDVLAEYVDAGGGVVVAVFANTSTNVDRFLQGRWQTGDYIAIPQNGGFVQGPGQLGEVVITDHPIMDGVTTFVTRSGTTAQGLIFGGYRPTNLSVTPGSTIVAKWNTGHSLVVLAPNPSVVELGFHPVSSDVNEFAYWDASTDGDLLMANALCFVAAPTDCPGDTNGDNLVNFTDLNAVLADFGSAGMGLAGDVNGDGMVNFTDLNIVLSAFGSEC